MSFDPVEILSWRFPEGTEKDRENLVQDTRHTNLALPQRQRCTVSLSAGTKTEEREINIFEQKKIIALETVPKLNI